jgi:hypothetical protein
MRRLCVSVVIAILASCGAASAADPPGEIDAKGVALLMEDKQAVFVVTSEKGIGNATVRLKSGKWPENVVLRFQYKEGSGFEMLESLDLRTDRFRISWQPSRDKNGGRKWGEQQLGFSLADADGKFAKDAPTAGYFVGKVEKTKKGIEVRLPANAFAGSKEVSLSWIDAFRQ